MAISIAGARVEAADIKPAGVGDDASSNDEIVVTAQRREEALTDVPISISVLAGNVLDRSSVTNVNDALQQVPGVSVTPNSTGGGGQLSIRGVTAANPVFLGSSPVAYYLDSVPFGFVKTALVPDTGAYDLDRIEVLRGPQGTLYGASAQNGVVRVLTKSADLNRFEFKARGSTSATKSGSESFRGDAAMNLPIVEGVLGARAVIGFQEAGGWIDRPNKTDANDERLFNARLKIKAQPTDDLSFGLTGWVSRSDFDAPHTGDSNNTIRSRWDEGGRSDFDMVGFGAEYELPTVLITSATSYLKYRFDYELDSALTGLNILSTDVDAKMFSQEFALNSTSDGPWIWSAGAIYRNARDRLEQLRRNPVTGALTGGYTGPAISRQISKSGAAFGELTRQLVDGKVELTAGLRYFEDHVSQDELANAFLPVRPLRNSSQKFDALSPRLVLTVHPSEKITGYASYSEGFRSGSDQTPAVLAVNPNFPPADADNLKNYEIGLKGALLDGKIRFDAAAYYMDWRKVQTPLLVQVAPATVNAALVNGTSASGLGFDFGVTVEPVPRLKLGASISKNDLTQDEDVVSSTTNTVVFREGERLNLSPKTTSSGNIDYAVPLGASGWIGRFSGAINHTSSRSQRILNITAQTVSNKPITMASARFTVESPDTVWAASIFADNLNNEKDAILTVPAGGAADRAIRPRPRTIGVQLEYRFR